MTWLYIVMDVIILLVLFFLCVFIVILWNKKRKLGRGTLDSFRNDELYEKSKEDRKKLKHIDDLPDEDEIPIDEIIEPEVIDDGDISFSAGYGGVSELEVTDDD